MFICTFKQTKTRRIHRKLLAKWNNNNMKRWSEQICRKCSKSVRKFISRILQWLDTINERTAQLQLASSYSSWYSNYTSIWNRISCPFLPQRWTTEIHITEQIITNSWTMLNYIQTTRTHRLNYDNISVFFFLFNNNNAEIKRH